MGLSDLTSCVPGEIILCAAAGPSRVGGGLWSTFLQCLPLRACACVPLLLGACQVVTFHARLMTATRTRVIASHDHVAAEGSAVFDRCGTAQGLLARPRRGRPGGVRGGHLREGLRWILGALDRVSPIRKKEGLQHVDGAGCAPRTGAATHGPGSTAQREAYLLQCGVVWCDHVATRMDGSGAPSPQMPPRLVQCTLYFLLL